MNWIRLLLTRLISRQIWIRSSRNKNPDCHIFILYWVEGSIVTNFQERHLCDICYFVNNLFSDPRWNSELSLPSKKTDWKTLKNRSTGSRKLWHKHALLYIPEKNQNTVKRDSKQKNSRNLKHQMYAPSSAEVILISRHLLLIFVHLLEWKKNNKAYGYLILCDKEK